MKVTVIDTYVVDVPTMAEGGRDDWVEEAEDRLNTVTDFMHRQVFKGLVRLRGEAAEQRLRQKGAANG